MLRRQICLMFPLLLAVQQKEIPTPKPSPTVPAAACATAVVVITAGLLVYFKRRRR
ncbi:MAG: hypothetical protein QXU99_03110 [Candidatus Bathyarchaeia archaeon]